MVTGDQDTYVCGVLQTELGLSLRSVWDLINGAYYPKTAIPILVDLLDVVTDPKTKEGMVRALSIRDAKPFATARLIEEFRKTTVSSDVSPLKWTIGNAIHVLADDTVYNEIRELTMNRDHAGDRKMIVLALGKMKNPDAVDVAISLLDDDDVAGHALAALARLRAPRSRPFIEPFLNHPRTWWRNEAKKALKRIDDVGAKGRD